MNTFTFLWTFIVWTGVAGGLLGLALRSSRLHLTILDLHFKVVSISRNRHDDDDEHDHRRAA
jgi:hypothetical protein